jgi:hypothetical protein
MAETVLPEVVSSLPSSVTDMDVIEGKDEEAVLFCDTEEARTLLAVTQEYDREEEFPRSNLLMEWKKHDRYWDGFQYLAWDEVARDWRTPSEIAAEDPTNDIDPSLSAKVINIYKAHGEILIGALTSGTPAVRFFPADADDHEDTQTAKAFSKISDLIQRQNRIKLLFMKALYILYNQGMLACYNESKADFKFGKISEPEYEDTPMVDRTSYCAACGETIGVEQLPSPAPPPEQMDCPECGTPMMPEVEDTPGTMSVLKEYKDKPKTRECLEVYGPMNVKIPLWVKEQSQTPYLILETEEHVALMREVYPEYADKINDSSYPDTREKDARVPTNYRGDWPRNLCTVQRVWLRPWALNIYARDLEQVKALRGKYPKGIYLVVINGTLVTEAVEDSLDEHWTITENPLATTLHARAIGAGMVPMQDIENELDNISLETIEFGIGEVFADPDVLDFDAYGKVEAKPGQISIAKAPTGQTLSAGFHEVKPATLSREVDLFAERMNSRQQFVQGTYPSIYGGAQDGGSGTAREYELSKASALQRLSTTWIILQEWFSKVMSKAVKSYVSNVKQDESFVKSQGNNFINVWIRQSELGGQVGEVEPEVSEAFPVSWAQKRDVLLNLMQMNNEDIAAVIRHPENASAVAEFLGVPELYIPGDDSRNKQLYEIALLVQEEPTELGVPGPDGQPGLLSSIPVTPELDDHEVEAEICKAWLRSEVGLDCKRSNPAGYANVLAHLKEHLFFVAQNEAAQAQDEEGAEGDKKKDSKSEEMSEV